MYLTDDIFSPHVLALGVSISRNARLLYSVFSFFSLTRLYALLAPNGRFHHVIVLFQVENNGFEPLTLCVQSRCSSQLS